MQTTERFEKVAVDRLVPYARNARTHSKEQILQLRASLREFGFVNPILVDADMNIIAGHGRVLAAKAEGMEAVPCVFVEHLTDAQKKAYILADNRLALSAGWDEELLALEFGELKDLGFDLELTGFDPAEIEKLFGKQDDVQEDDFDVDAAAGEPPIAQRGDLWLLEEKRQPRMVHRPQAVDHLGIRQAHQVQAAPDHEAPRPAGLSHRQLHAGQRHRAGHLRRLRQHAHGLPTRRG